ncbi:MAG: hypothetical protein ABH873_06150 [Candidatus Firestonebacteria bacterium]
MLGNDCGGVAHSYNIKNKIKTITIKYYDVKTTVAEYDGLGNLIKAKKNEVKTFMEIKMNNESASKVNWSNDNIIEAESLKKLLEIKELNKSN